MTTRTEDKEEEEPRSAGPDHFVVSARSMSFFVSTAMAAHIEASLDRKFAGSWICFVDLTGSRVRLHRREIEYIYQSTAEQRAVWRRYNRAMKQEAKADKDWGDGD